MGTMPDTSKAARALARKAVRKYDRHHEHMKRVAAEKRDGGVLGTGAYSRLWGIVDGGVRDALSNHPDYLTPKGLTRARTSIVKRVTGTIIGFAEQSAKGRNAADTEAGVQSPAPLAEDVFSVAAGAGAVNVSPTFRVRIKSIRFKHRTRYRSPQAFDLTTSALFRALHSPAAERGATRGGV